MMTPRIGRQLLGTFIAVLAGWVAALVFLEAATAIELLQEPHYVVPEALLVGPMLYGSYMAFFIVPVWLLVLIPLYLFVPPSSVLWRWPICTICGVLAALVIIGLFYGGIPGFGALDVSTWYYYLMAAIVGGVTCLTAALTRHRFKTII